MEIFQEINSIYLIALFLIGTGAFLLSSISGGGGALVLVPVVNIMLGPSQTAPILNLGTLLGRPSRLIIFWKHIQWKICFYYVPFALIGSVLGAYLFQEMNLGFLQILVGLFLVSTLWQFRFGKKKASFLMKLSYFPPLAFLVSLLGTLIGAMGPILNPFYLNLGLDKEDLIATKTANSFFMGLAQVGAYSFFGSLNPKLWVYGLCLGLGATLGNILGKRFLGNMSSKTFRKWVVWVMAISGFVLVLNQILEMT